METSGLLQLHVVSRNLHEALLSMANVVSINEKMFADWGIYFVPSELISKYDDEDGWTLITLFYLQKSGGK